MPKDNGVSMNKVNSMNRELSDLLRGESIALTGNDVQRAEDILGIHNRYNDVIQRDYQGIRSSKDPSDSTYDYITNAILGRGRDYTSAAKTFQDNRFTTGNKVQDKLLKNGQLERLFTMGDSQVASYFLSSSSDIVHIYDEIDSVCGYFYQLEEANLLTRDNVLRAEQVNEDISMNIEFPGVTEDTSSYVNIVKKALEYQNVTIKIRDHIVPKAIKYGNYYIMVIPYSEIGAKLMALSGNGTMGFGGYPFYESTDTHALFQEQANGEDGSTVDSCMESVTTLFESIDPSEEKDKNGKPVLSKKAQEALGTIKDNLSRIYVCEDTSIPDIEGLGTHKKLSKTITDGIEAAIKHANSSINEDDPSISSKIKISINTDFDKGAKHEDIKEPDANGKSVTNSESKSDSRVGGIDNDKFEKLVNQAGKDAENNNNMRSTFADDDVISEKDLAHSEDMVGCHIKLVDPRQLIPIKIFDYVVGYYYFENYDFAKMGTSVTDIMSNQMNFDQNSLVIDEIVDSVLKGLKYGDVLKGDNQLRSMILNCILYAEKRDNPIRIKFVRPDYVIPWKTNLDENDNGQPTMLRSLLYARLYTSLMLFYTTAIITKSTDSEFYYLKESALDGQINNQISDMMDQLEDSNVDPIQIANGNILHGNRAINKRYFVNMGTSEIKPFEMDVVSGQQIDLHNDFLTDLKKMAIGSTGVPAVMVDYVDEIEYATMLGMANIKHLVRCNGIKKDFNPSLTQTAKVLVKNCYPHSIPDNILDKMVISLRESKVINNNMTSQQLNDNLGMCENMVKTWVGGDTTNPPEITNFIIEEMTKQLVIAQTPSAPWELLPEMYKQACMKARQTSVYNKVMANATSGDSTE